MKRLMRIVFRRTYLNASFIACLVVTSTMAGEESKLVTTLKDDETIVFFRTAAWLDDDGSHWQIPIHGWVYEPEHSRVRKAAAAEIIEEQFGLVADESTSRNFSERINLLIADNERDKSIVIDLAGNRYRLPSSTSNGHFSTIIAVPVANISLANEQTLTYSAAMDEADPRQFKGEVLIPGPSGHSVISDIDDTVKLTYVTDHKKLVNATFLQDFKPVPGMAETYGHWFEQGSSFHYVSSSPWQLYQPLTEFLDQHQFPPASLTLKNVRFRDETLLNLLKEGTETKPELIRAIINRYPSHRFTLVGDSGEQDPEVYALIAQEYGDQIAAIWIRNINADQQLDEKLSTVFSQIPITKWRSFVDAKEISDATSSPGSNNN